MKIQQLSNEEATGHGFTHMAVITNTDLTQSTANTAQTIDILNPVAAGATIGPVAMVLVKPFKDTADAAFNSTTVSVGDGTAVTTHIAAQQMNGNGTVVTNSRGNTLVNYAAANKLTITFNSMTGKSLSSIKEGEVRVLFCMSIPALTANP